MFPFIFYFFLFFELSFLEIQCQKFDFNGLSVTDYILLILHVLIQCIEGYFIRSYMQSHDKLKFYFLV